MCRTYVIDHQSAAEGLSFRTPTQGPEREHVFSYIDHLVEANSKSRRNSVDCIFIEPRIDSGFPDVVVSRFDQSVLEYWNEQRKHLTDNHLRIMAYLLQCKKHVDLDDIEWDLGFSRSRSKRILSLLCECGIAIQSRSGWRAAKRSSFIGVRDLMAVEAKTSCNPSVFSQAVMNRRFSSRSYVMVSSSRPAKRTMQSCVDLGLGMISGSQFDEIVTPESRRLPACYVTLKFNEWVGSYLLGDRAIPR